jgi:hypothetical protein
MPIVLFDGSNSVGTPVSERRTGREGAVREHPIDGRAGLAFVEEQHSPGVLLRIVGSAQNRSVGAAASASVR